MRPAALPLLLGSLLALAGCGGETLAHHQRYLYEQKCAACHGVPGRPAPDPRARSLFGMKLTREQVRRAIIDGRPGMPKGLLGDGDVDQVADYLSKGAGT
ncbi:MAG: c-type cytochrome [Gaiellales bacterium]